MRIKRDKVNFQGDLAVMPVESIPSDVVEEEVSKEGFHTVAHSETGHHHVISAQRAKLFVVSAMVSYLRVVAEYADLQHLRPVDQHETLRLPKGEYKLLRQRERTPEGWRRVED